MQAHLILAWNITKYGSRVLQKLSIHLRAAQAADHLTNRSAKQSNTLLAALWSQFPLCVVPVQVYFPIEMHMVVAKIPTYSTKGILLRTLSFICLLISLASAIGSIEYVVQDLKVSLYLGLWEYTRIRGL